MKQVTIPGNSFLAIMDKQLKEKGLKPVYIWNKYFDTIKRKTQGGILLYTIDGHVIPFDEKHKENFGILGFVNGQEPGEGSIPLHEIIPQKEDTVALAYIIQGMYKGDFSQAKIHEGKALKEEKEIHALHLVHAYTVQEKDLVEKAYEIVLLEEPIVSRELK